MRTSISRREFLQKSLAGAGLTIAISMTSSGCRLMRAEDLKKDTALMFSPNAWIQITPDETVKCILNKSEMGQGIYTSLPMIIADELEADWRNICFQAAPAGAKYVDPTFGMQVTGGSTSIRHMFEPLRMAAAVAREMLIRAAAETWAVSVKECQALQGKVQHVKSGRSLTYGELCERASQLSVPQNPPLKKEDQFRLIGKSMSRLDVWDKVNGSATFGTDVFVPGMLYSAIARPPAYGAKATSYDESAAERVPGVSKVVPIDRGIAVCADTLHAAWEGREALQIQWGKGSYAGLNNATLEKDFLDHLNKQGVKAREEGDVKNALRRAAKKAEATFILPYLAHVTMEPMNCTVYIRPDRCDLWNSTQNQTGILQLAQKITGLSADQIYVHTTYLGGGFGRRAEVDVVEEALQLAKATGKPIKIIWTREEDMQHDFYRPGNCCKIEAGIDGNGQITAWSHMIVAPSIFARIFPMMVRGGVDPAAVEGIVEPYAVPNIQVEYVKIDTPVPVGFWRSVGSSHNAFTVESFMDELAHLARRDPLDFRLSHLKGQPRARLVLELAAEKAGWGKPIKEGRGLGIAYHFSFGTHVAQVAEISANEKDGSMKVHRVVCAVDCGQIVNPAIITAQMESGILMGLSASLKEKVDFAKGGVESANFYNYDILRIHEIPEIEVHIVKTPEKMGGIGEPGLPPIAPAVANAIFKATGIRVRRLPMTPETVIDATRKS
jgi:isoquinoline 1-oxidoreductase beta subunit